MYYLFSENKGADQLRSYREADLRLVFAYAKSWFSHDAAHMSLVERKPIFRVPTGCNTSQSVQAQMSHIVRKQTFCICENKDADQLRGNREADQRLCFCFIDSTIPLLPIYEISSLLPSCVVVQPGLCGAWLEIQKTGFLTTRLKC